MAIVVDANVLLRFLTEPATAQDRRAKAVASELLGQAREGAVTLLLTDAVVAEVLFILTHPRQYDASRQAAADAMLPILMLPGCRMAHRDACLRAVELWRDHPHISFVDALVAAAEAAAGGRVRIKTVYCLGLCSAGPAARVGDRLHARLDAAALVDLVNRL